MESVSNEKRLLPSCTQRGENLYLKEMLQSLEPHGWTSPEPCLTQLHCHLARQSLQG